MTRFDNIIELLRKDRMRPVDMDFELINFIIPEVPDFITLDKLIRFNGGRYFENYFSNLESYCKENIRIFLFNHRMDKILKE